MAVTERLCLFCEHFVWERCGTGADYSECTGGDDYGGASCKKSHFNEDRPYDEDDLRRILIKAVSCDDYKPPK